MQGVLDTTVHPYPVGVYNAQVRMEDDALTESTGTSKNDPSKTWHKLRINLNIIDPQLAAARGNDKLYVKYDFFLDYENGLLASGPQKNIQLGAFMKACGLNEKGRSILESKGKMVSVQIAHRADPTDPEKIYNEVKAVGVAQQATRA